MSGFHLIELEVRQVAAPLFGHGDKAAGNVVRLAERHPRLPRQPVGEVGRDADLEPLASRAANAPARALRPAALDLLEAGQAKRVLISGVGLDVRPVDLAATYRRPVALFDCCVALGREAVDTRSNGQEVARWVERRGYSSIRLVTTDWHMRRARFELDRALPNNIAVTNDAVSTHASLSILFKEYNKYWLRAVASLLGL